MKCIRITTYIGSFKARGVASYGVAILSLSLSRAVRTKLHGSRQRVSEMVEHVYTYKAYILTATSKSEKEILLVNVYMYIMNERGRTEREQT